MPDSESINTIREWVEGKDCLVSSSNRNCYVKTKPECGFSEFQLGVSLFIDS